MRSLYFNYHRAQRFQGLKILEINNLKPLPVLVIKNEWGKMIIVLPNTTYGEWENA
jgi:hypothetical protein